MKKELGDRQYDIIKFLTKKWKRLDWHQEIMFDVAVIMALAVNLSHEDFKKRIEYLLK